MSEATKVCRGCKETKALELFNKETRSEDGRNARCKICTAEYNRRYRERHPDKIKAKYQNNKAMYKAKAKAWKAANPDKVKAYEKKYRDTHKEAIRAWAQANMDKIKEKSKQWAKANPEKRRQIARNWNARNRPHLLERVKKWRAANREKLRYQSNARAKKAVDSLADHYVRYSLLGFKATDNVPKALVEAKRLEVLIKRRVKDEDSNRTT